MNSFTSKIKFIDDSFGLTAKMFSLIYKVEKSTYYNWLNDQDTKQSDKINRINDIYNIAVEVSKFNSHRYGTKAKTFIPSLGRTLFDLLCDDELESSQIISVCRELTTSLKKWDNLSNASKHGNSYHHHTIVRSHNYDN